MQKSLLASAIICLTGCSTLDQDALIQAGTAILTEINKAQTPTSQTPKGQTPTPQPKAQTPTPQSTAQDTTFEVVNTGKTHTGAAFTFQKPKPLTYVQTEVTVSQIPQTGLNFYAIQVNFDNGTWAHGGLQFNKGQNALANWGGLVFRGGGAADYEKMHKDDLQKIQNQPPTTRPYAWQTGKTYELTVWRGKQVTLPAGEVKHNGKMVNVDERTMWAWHFNIAPTDGGQEYNATLYNSAATIKDFMVWSECGYGSCGQTQKSRWSMPIYATNAWDDSFEVSKRFQRF